MKLCLSHVSPLFLLLFPTHIKCFSTLKAPANWANTGRLEEEKQKQCAKIYIFIRLGFFPLGNFGTPLDNLFMVYSLGVEWERKKKKPAPLALFFSTLYTHHVNGKNPKPAFSELYLSAWLLEKTSVVQMWDGKSGLYWHRPCGCFGAGAQSAVGYRCLLSTINVANM